MRWCHYPGYWNASDGQPDLPEKAYGLLSHSGYYCKFDFITQGSYASIQVLKIGAFDMVNKPGGSINIQKVIEEIVFKICRAYKVKDKFVEKFKDIQKTIAGKKSSAPPPTFREPWPPLTNSSLLGL